MAKGNVAASTSVLLAMMVVTVIIMPFLLPLTVSALAPQAKCVVTIELVALLLYVNLLIYAFSSQFVRVWWGAYLAAIAVPIIGINLGSVISVVDRAARHASVITTAQRSITAAIVVTIFNYTQPLANVSVTIINTTGIVLLLLLALEWGRGRDQEKSMTNAGATSSVDGCADGGRSD